MESDNNNLHQLITHLEWQLNMGVEAMVEENNNNNSDIDKDKINKGDVSKLKGFQKLDTSYVKKEDIYQDESLQQSINNCLTLEELKN